LDADRRRAKAVAGPANPVIPDKLYFRIGEVASLLGVATYVLRFWEVEFSQLSPTKGGSGQRLYRRRDVEMALRIKRLLYNEGYTIPGARQLLKAEVRERQPELPLELEEPKANPHKLNRMRTELEEIAGILARPLPGKRRLPKAEPSEKRKALHLTPRKSTEAVDGDEKPLGSDEIPS
jgi:DNA-binding transcriptional MerR regulator